MRESVLFGTTFFPFISLTSGSFYMDRLSPFASGPARSISLLYPRIPFDAFFAASLVFDMHYATLHAFDDICSRPFLLHDSSVD